MKWWERLASYVLPGVKRLFDYTFAFFKTIHVKYFEAQNEFVAQAFYALAKREARKRNDIEALRYLIQAVSLDREARYLNSEDQEFIGWLKETLLDKPNRDSYSYAEEARCLTQKKSVGKLTEAEFSRVQGGYCIAIWMINAKLDKNPKKPTAYYYEELRNFYIKFEEYHQSAIEQTRLLFLVDDHAKLVAVKNYLRLMREATLKHEKNSEEWKTCDFILKLWEQKEVQLTELTKELTEIAEQFQGIVKEDNADAKTEYSPQKPIPPECPDEIINNYQQSLPRGTNYLKLRLKAKSEFDRCYESAQFFEKKADYQSIANILTTEVRGQIDLQPKERSKNLTRASYMLGLAYFNLQNYNRAHYFFIYAVGQDKQGNLYTKDQYAKFADHIAYIRFAEFLEIVDGIKDPDYTNREWQRYRNTYGKLSNDGYIAIQNAKEQKQDDVVQGVLTALGIIETRKSWIYVEKAKGTVGIDHPAVALSNIDVAIWLVQTGVDPKPKFPLIELLELRCEYRRKFNVMRENVNEDRQRIIKLKGQLKAKEIEEIKIAEVSDDKKKAKRRKTKVKKEPLQIKEAPKPTRQDPGKKAKAKAEKKQLKNKLRQQRKADNKAEEKPVEEKQQKYKIEIPAFCSEVIRRLKTNKKAQQTWLTGGYVRNHLREQLTKVPAKKTDFDIVTSASVSEVLEEFKAENIQINLYNPRLLRFIKDGSSYDIYCSEHLANPNSENKLLDDARGRNFRVNANYADENGDVEIVFKESIADLKEGKLRATTTAKRSYGEDPIRILNAALLVGKEKFQVPEEDLEFIEKNASKLKKKSRAGSVNAILYKMLASEEVCCIFDFLLDQGILRELIPIDEHKLKAKREEFHKVLRYQQTMPSLSSVYDFLLGYLDETADREKIRAENKLLNLHYSYYDIKKQYKLLDRSEAKNFWLRNLCFKSTVGVRDTFDLLIKTRIFEQMFPEMIDVIKDKNYRREFNSLMSLMQNNLVPRALDFIYVYLIEKLADMNRNGISREERIEQIINQNPLFKEYFADSNRYKLLAEEVNKAIALLPKQSTISLRANKASLWQPAVGMPVGATIADGPVLRIC